VTRTCTDSEAIGDEDGCLNTQHKADGSTVEFEALHTFSDEQVEWFKAGSALNIVRQRVAGK
jgi:aconitase A